MLQRLATADVWVAGVLPGPKGVDVVYTAVIPAPMAEAQLDVTVGTKFAWRTLHASAGKGSRTSCRNG